MGTQNQYQEQHYPEKPMKQQLVRDTCGKQDLCINTFPAQNRDYIFQKPSLLLAQVLNGIVNCACHDGFGILECKCPWSGRDKLINDMF